MDFDVSLLSPAKINLFLHINGRRPDGYHELQTLFQLLDAGDQMRFKTLESDEIRVTPEMADIPLETNLIYRAARLLQKETGIGQGAHIHIDKQLPMGGGVGGGSSNAATTLLALNRLWQCGLSENRLMELGLQLGADVPVFIQGKTAFAEGVGEHLSPLKIREKWYLILCPKCHVSTAEIFSDERLTRDTPKIKIAPALEGQALEALLETTQNDCEALASELYPEIKEAISWLNQFGHGRLTGTGACCFCSFDTKQAAQRALTEAQSKFEGFIAKGVFLSPALKGLNEAG